MVNDPAFVIGFLAALIAVLSLRAVRTRQTGGEPKVYDERQLAVRGRANRWAYQVLAIYVLLYALFNDLGGLQWAQPFPAVMIGVCLSILVFAFICLKSDAYVSLTTRPQRLLWILAIVCIINFAGAYTNIINEGMLTNGMLNANSVNLIVGITFAILFIAILMQHLRNQNAADDEEE